MTDRQYKICKIILKERSMNKILKRTGFDHIVDLKEEFEDGDIYVSNLELNETTEVGLSNRLIEQVESRKRNEVKDTLHWIISVAGLVLSIASFFRP